MPDPSPVTDRLDPAIRREAHEAAYLPFGSPGTSPADSIDRALDAVYPLIRDQAAAAERDRLKPLLDAYRALYDLMWNGVGTFDNGQDDNWNLISHDDTNAIEEACLAVEAQLDRRCP